MRELKSCPFCGGEAQISDGGYSGKCFATRCQNERCVAHGQAVYETEEEAIAAWNTRTATLQEYQPWVSVEDRLPTEDDADDNGRIQIYWSNGLVDVWKYVLMREHVIKYYDDTLVKVTHWKPLPEPPQREEQT